MNSSYYYENMITKRYNTCSFHLSHQNFCTDIYSMLSHYYFLHFLDARLSALIDSCFLLLAFSSILKHFEYFYSRGSQYGKNVLFLDSFRIYSCDLSGEKNLGRWWCQMKKVLIFYQHSEADFTFIFRELLHIYYSTQLSPSSTPFHAFSSDFSLSFDVLAHYCKLQAQMSLALLKHF